MKKYFVQVLPPQTPLASGGWVEYAFVDKDAMIEAAVRRYMAVYGQPGPGEQRTIIVYHFRAGQPVYASGHPHHCNGATVVISGNAL